MFRIRKEPVEPKRQVVQLSLPQWFSQNGIVVTQLSDVPSAYRKAVEDLYLTEDGNCYYSHNNDFGWYPTKPKFKRITNKIYYDLPPEITYDDISLEGFTMYISLIEADKSFMPSYEAWLDKYNEWHEWYEENRKEIEAELNRREKAKNERLRKDKEKKRRELASKIKQLEEKLEKV